MWGTIWSCEYNEYLYLYIKIRFRIREDLIMKKQVCMMMAAVMAAVALTGCSGGTKETAAATEAETTQATATAAETEAETYAGETTAARAGESTEILVAAAASLKNAYEDELIPMFQEQLVLIWMLPRTVTLMLVLQPCSRQQRM